MIDFGNYESLKSDSKEVELIEVKSKKDENIPMKSDSSTSDNSFNDSMEQMNSLIVKEKPVTKKFTSIKYKNRNGNTFQYFINERGAPKIVIGPHCKKKLIL
jgi:hypothetical protein